MAETLLEVRHVKKYFPVFKGILREISGWVKAVDDVSFSMAKAQTFGLVGESGCGKTTTANLILRLEELTAGSILFEGAEVHRLFGGGLRKYRAAVQPVFQDPSSSLDPRMRCGDIISEPIVANNLMPGRLREQRVAEVLEMVNLLPEYGKCYPHELSGGQKQRVAVARALSSSPRLIVLDEPVSSLDVSIRAQTMNLLHDIQDKSGVAYLLIAHDLATIRYMSHKIGVMYLGKMVEIADSEELYRHPTHPYTRALLSAALPDHPDEKREEIILSGEVTSPLNLPPGCRFHPRCYCAKPECSRTEPTLVEVAPGHLVACHK